MNFPEDIICIFLVTLLGLILLLLGLKEWRLQQMSAWLDHITARNESLNAELTAQRNRDKTSQMRVRMALGRARKENRDELVQFKKKMEILEEANDEKTEEIAELTEKLRLSKKSLVRVAMTNAALTNTREFMSGQVRELLARTERLTSTVRALEEENMMLKKEAQVREKGYKRSRSRNRA